LMVCGAIRSTLTTMSIIRDAAGGPHNKERWEDIFPAEAKYSC